MATPYEVREQDLDNISAGRSVRRIAIIAHSDDGYVVEQTEPNVLTVVSNDVERLVNKRLGKPVG